MRHDIFAVLTLYFFLLCFELKYVSLQPEFCASLASKIGIASRPFRLRSKCSICSRRFESRRWSHWGQALSSGFLDIGQDHPSSLGPVPRIVSTLQCRRVRSTPVSFGKRESSSYKMKKCKLFHRLLVRTRIIQIKRLISDQSTHQINFYIVENSTLQVLRYSKCNS